MPLLAPLAARFHIFVPDRPGCGLTEPVDYRHVDFRKHAAHFVEAFLDALALPQVTLVGNSIGGFFSLAFALAHPERVRKLVLIGTPLGVNRWMPLAMRALGIPGLNRLLFATVAKPRPGGTRERFRRMLVANIATVPEPFLQAAYQGELISGTQESWRTMLERITILRGLDPACLLVDTLPTVRPSTLLIWGDKDVFGSPAHGAKTRDLIPDARLAIVKNAGHIPWFDAPEECTRLIVDFVAETVGNGQTISHGRQS